MGKKKITYKDAGVDIDAGRSFVSSIRPFVESTRRPEVIGAWGAFSGLFRLDLSKYENPVLVSATDGVGTKLKIAFALGRHDTVGIDLVAMCVNDLVCQGAEPLFFLDYLASGKLRRKAAIDIVKGIAQGCKEADCALIGGETAELPGFYSEGEYDLAGFAVGIVDEKNVIDGSAVSEGDALLGLASSGLHSNGYSLAREALLNYAGLSLNETVKPLNIPLGRELLKPTRIYSGIVNRLLANHEVNGIAHITGGGIVENLGRVIPDGLTAEVSKDSLPVLPVFELIKELGNVEEREMFRTFNMGVGIILVAPGDEAAAIISELHESGEQALQLGEVKTGGSEGKVIIR